MQPSASMTVAARSRSRVWLARFGQASWRCALGIVLGICAGFGQWYLRSIGVMSLMLLPYPAILLAAGVGGLLAGLVALVVTTLSLAYVVEPSGSFLVAAQRDALDLLLFCVIGFVLVLLTERRKRALALARAAHARAENASAAKEAIMAVIAHDLRNPLQSIALSSELLASKLQKDAQVACLLDRMRRSVERAATLVDAAVERAVEPGGDLLRVRKSRCSLRDLTSEVIAHYEPLALARGITLRTPAPETLEGAAWCDKDRVMQILGNLLGNAFKFTPAGGVVELAISSDDEGTHLAVVDTGRGMTSEELAHCFERTWHGSAPGSGSGLGLWIASSLIEAHGGRLSATSEVGHGTTMSFVLPLEPAAASEPVTRPLASNPA